MKAILFIVIFVSLCTSFAQKDTLKVVKDSPIKINPLPIDSVSVSVEVEKINERYKSILKTDELIDKKIAEIIKDGKKETAKLKNENKKLAEKVEIKNEKIDSLSTLVQKYEDATILVDSICVRWGFLSRHIDDNCKEWKIVIVK